jgi:cellulose synthase/poly-beta-1,6-N-acetylglucosamine synthase-like glycosyltransferase
VIVFEVLFWTGVGLLAWTHVFYPALAAVGARVRPRPVRAADELPRVAVIVAAHDEEAVIARRVENLLALDYPRDRFEVIVSSDASTDRTDELAAAAGARVVRCPRGGKVAAQDRGVRETDAEIVAFSDANAVWPADALRKLVRALADPDVAFVCGQVRLEAADGSNKEGLYWRYEMALREAESRLGSITGSNGAIYAVRRSDYLEVDPRFGHDLSLPYLMVQRGRRAVYDPEALSFEKPTPSNATEYRRKVRMFEHCWLMVLRGRMLRGVGPLYALQLVSHRHLRYLSGLVHVVVLATSALLATSGWVYAAALAVQLGWLAAAAAGVGIARYTVLVNWATIVALWNYWRRGVPATWKVAEGTR